MSETSYCGHVQNLAPELATGVASGDERAQALAHLAQCRECRQELDTVAMLVDELVLLAPGHEPSAGFETSVLAAIKPAPRPRAQVHRVLLRSASLTLVAALGAGLTWWYTADDRQLAAGYRQTLAVANGHYLTAADVATQGDPEVGHVFGYQGTPSWLFVTLTAAPEPGTYDVRLVTVDGRDIEVGTCVVTHGRSSWGTAVNVPIRNIHHIELHKAGAPVMTARFP